MKSSLQTRSPRPDTPAGYQMTCTQNGQGTVVLRLAGVISFGDAETLWTDLQRHLAHPFPAAVHFDLSDVDTIDGSAVALLVKTRWNLQTQGVTGEFVGASAAAQRVFTLYGADETPAAPVVPAAIGPLGGFGNVVVSFVIEWQLFAAFVGSMVLALIGIVRRPSTANWRDVPSLMVRTGADAVPIVSLITFLVGVVMAFQAAVQLKQFGADIFVADLVALSITRELGPLMTAIIVCGRSGAAFAAELGTMRVSEEIDALRTIGIGPLRFLVFPRILALVLVMPILTLLGDFLGILGGMLVAILSLDISMARYIAQTIKALSPWDIFQGVVKAGVFGLAIGFISCEQGLATVGGAEGVGRRTTASVVKSLFAIIVLDAFFTMGFHELGL